MDNTNTNNEQPEKEENKVEETENKENNNEGENNNNEENKAENQEENNENNGEENENNEDEKKEIEVVQVVEELVEQRKPKKKKKRRVRYRKPRRRQFDTNGNIHLKPLEYNALKDEHLKGFFYSKRIRNHLESMSLVTKDGYIIENPEEYWKHKKIIRQHYRNNSTGRKIKKKKKKKKSKKKEYTPGKGVPKDKFQDFLNGVKQGYGSDENGGEGEEEDIKPTPLKPVGDLLQSAILV